MKITKRERILMFGGATILILTLVAVLGKKLLGSLSSSSNTLEKVMAEKRKLLQLTQEYKNLVQPINFGGDLDNMENRVITSLEKFSLRDQAGNLAPKFTSIDSGKFEKKTIIIRIKEVKAMPVMQFIKDIEYGSDSPKIKIEKFYSRENKKTEGLYEFNIVLTAYAKKKS